MFKLLCEWDIGHEDLVFEDKVRARKWATQALKNSGIQESFQECFEQGLIDFREVTIV